LTSPPQPAREPPSLLSDDVWTAAVFDTLRDYGKELMRLTTLANAVGRLGNFTRRAD